MSEVLKCQDILEKILVFLDDGDLYSLIQTCKQIRDIVGMSNVWTRSPEDKRILEYVNVEKVFQLFMSIKLGERGFAMRSYYGDHYYLRVMKLWIKYDSWNVYSLINNQDDLVKLYKICCHIEELELGKQYQEWIPVVKSIGEKMEKIQHPDKDNILRMIYINHKYHCMQYDKYRCTTIHICTRSLTSNHYYDIEFKFPVPEIFVNTDEKGYEITMGKESLKIQEIAKNIEVDFATLSDILKIMLGRGSLENEKMIANLF